MFRLLAFLGVFLAPTVLYAQAQPGDPSLAPWVRKAYGIMTGQLKFASFANGSEPATCDASNSGATVYSTTDNTLRYCNGTTWGTVGGGGGGTVTGTGATDRLAIWSGVSSITSSANLTFPAGVLTLSGGLTQSTGAVSLSANAASSLTTSSGALTLTSAASATWSVGTGTLTLLGETALDLQTGAAPASRFSISAAGNSTFTGSLDLASFANASEPLTCNAGNSGNIIYSSTDNLPRYCNGTAWTNIGTGTVTGSGTATQIAFWSTSSALSSDADLYWDNTSKFFGVRTSTPSFPLHVRAAGGTSIAGAWSLFSSNPTTAGNMYTMILEKSGTASLIMGINKNTTTGSVPADSPLISTYGPSQGLAIGRGDAADHPSSVDIYIAPTTGFVGINTTSVSSTLDVLQSAATTGSPIAFRVTGGAHTTLTASTEVTDFNINLDRIVQRATGGVATQRAAIFHAPTYSFVGASTITNAATLSITGAPVAGTNATISTSRALWVQSGLAAFDGTSISTVSDVVTSATSDAAIVAHTLTSGTAASGFGTTLAFRTLNDAGTTITSRMGVEHTIVTAGSDRTRFTFYARNSGALTNVATLDPASGLNVMTPASSAGLTHTAGSNSFNTFISSSEIRLQSVGDVPHRFVHTVTGPLAAGTELIDYDYALDRTVTFATGGLATQRAVVFRAPTYAFSGASTLVDAATVAVTAAPVAGTNATITNAYALLVQDGSLGVPVGSSTIPSLRFAGAPLSPSGIFLDSGVFKVQLGVNNPLSVGTGSVTVSGVQFVASGGVASVPGITFSGDTNTGFYNAFADAIGFTGGGTDMMILNAQLGTLGAGTEAIVGTITTGTHTWAIGSPTTVATERLVLVTQPTIGFSAGGGTFTDAATFAIAGAPLAGANSPTITRAWALWVQAGASGFPDGTAAAPALTFGSDADTGVYRSTTNEMSFSAGGAQKALVNGTGLSVTSREREAKGADVTAAATLTLGSDGNYFVITGNTNIDYITTTDWTAGSMITLEFTGTPTVNHNTATPPGGTASIHLAGSTNFTAGANDDVLTFRFNGTVWKEVARTVF